jgi:hypothetical protein
MVKPHESRIQKLIGWEAVPALATLPGLPVKAPLASDGP